VAVGENWDACGDADATAAGVLFTVAVGLAVAPVVGVGVAVGATVNTNDPFAWWPSSAETVVQFTVYTPAPNPDASDTIIVWRLGSAGSTRLSPPSTRVPAGPETASELPCEKTACVKNTRTAEGALTTVAFAGGTELAYCA
jgi:hypothetical protein